MYIKKLQCRLRSSYELAKSSLIAKEVNKEQHDKTLNIMLFSVGDKVLLNDERIRRGRSLKLSPPWIGPYEITKVDDVNITLKLHKEQNSQGPRKQTETVLWLMIIIWEMTPCGSYKNRRSGGSYRLHLQGARVRAGYRAKL
jgi:hypothetical protein